MKIQNRANGYLRESPARYADIYTHAGNVTSEELAKMRSELDAAENYAKAAIEMGQAADKAMASNDPTEARQTMRIAAKKLQQASLALDER
jgi:hypothetical protein